MEFWGQLNFFNVVYSFCGGDIDIQQYFLSFYQSLNKIKHKCNNEVIVDFNNNYKVSCEEVRKSIKIIIEDLLYFYVNNDNLILECVDNWSIIDYGDHIEVSLNKQDYLHLDVLNQSLRDMISYNALKYDLIFLHAGGLSLPWGNALVFGKSGTGKSTLSIGLGIQSECSLLSDDRTLLYADKNRIYLSTFGFPITFRAGTAQICDLLSEYESSVPENVFIEKELNYKYKIAVDYKKTFKNDRIFFLQGNINLVFLNRDDSCSNPSFKKIDDYSDFEDIIDDYYNEGEISCNNINDFKKNMKSKGFIFSYPFGDKYVFENTIQQFILGPIDSREVTDEL